LPSQPGFRACLTIRDAVEEAALVVSSRTDTVGERQQRAGYGTFAAPFSYDRYLRTADIADALTAKRSFALSHAGVEVVVLKPVGRRGSPFTKER
jgi:hypothetical protein